MRYIATPDGKGELIGEGLLPVSSFPNPKAVIAFDTILDGPYDSFDMGPNSTPADYKLDLARRREISCSFCSYHKGENASRPDNGWKTHRVSQYRIKERSFA